MSVFESPKLVGVLPKQIIVIADYDLTLAMKNDPNDTDKAPLLPSHYLGLSELASRICRFVTVTARGQESVLNYLGEHEDMYGRVPNVTLASNSGHLVHELDRPRTEQYIIDVPHCSRHTLYRCRDTIHTIVDGLKTEYPDLTADRRELCGAVVYQFDTADQARIKGFQNRVDAIEAATKAEIHFAQKEWPCDGRLMGYVDMTPKGMCKGYTTPIVFNRYKDKAGPDPFVIVMGDSSADYKMMEALAPLIPAHRRLFLSVGKGLVACDDAHENHTGQRLLDHVFTGNGKHPVEQAHDFLTTVGVDDDRRTMLDARHRDRKGPHEILANG
ncbi:MAG: hypothetical protein KGI37_05975 [Alphaproteobacteria bacterium]|nr:hypothetical protein [Alphaproteobacteria bacterium]